MLNRRLSRFAACALSLFAVTHCGDSGGSDSAAGGSGNQAGLRANGGKSAGGGGSDPAGNGGTGPGDGGAPETPIGGGDGIGGLPGGAVGGASSVNGGGAGASPGFAGAPADGGGGAACVSTSPTPTASVYDGDLALQSAADIDAARVYSRITGCLTLDLAAGDVSLPNLVSLGALHAQSSALTRLSLPNVRTVDGELWVYLNGSLTELDLRHVEEVSGRLYIHRNIALTNLQLVSLRSVHGSTTHFDGDSEITGNIRVPGCLLDIPKARFEVFAFTGGLPNCSCSLECDLVSVDGC